MSKIRRRKKGEKRKKELLSQPEKKKCPSTKIDLQFSFHFFRTYSFCFYRLLCQQMVSSLQCQIGEICMEPLLSLTFGIFQKRYEKRKTKQKQKLNHTNQYRRNEKEKSKEKKKETKRKEKNSAWTKFNYFLETNFSIQRPWIIIFS